MKSQTAAEVAAAIELAQGGWRPASGELKLIACVDEETGGELGAQWLCENEPDLARCDYLINEGAGAVMPWGKERLYGVCTAEKGVFRFTLTAHGEAGHASMPGVADNALPKLGAALTAFATNRPSYDLTEAPAILFDALGVEGLETLRARDPKLASFVEPMASVTFAPTMISASEKINVIPSRATLKVDCRVPPGLGEETARKRIAEVLGSLDEYDLEFTERVVGNSSPVDTVLFDAIDRWVSAEDKKGKAVPTMLPAFTDSRWFRDAFPDIVAYGFFPQRQMTLYESWPLVHGKDERIAVADVELAAGAYAAIARDLLGADRQPRLPEPGRQGLLQRDRARLVDRRAADSGEADRQLELDLALAGELALPASGRLQRQRDLAGALRIGREGLDPGAVRVQAPGGLDGHRHLGFASLDVALQLAKGDLRRFRERALALGPGVRRAEILRVVAEAVEVEVGLDVGVDQ